MLRIRKITGPGPVSGRNDLEHVKDIIARQFPDIRKERIDKLDEQLINPLKFKYQSILLLAENIHDTIMGFALIKFMPDLRFCYLDFIAASPGKTSSGVGGALYQRVREEAEAIGSSGLLFEALPDDTELCYDKTHLLQNAKRLAFYER